MTFKIIAFESRRLHEQHGLFPVKKIPDHFSNVVADDFGGAAGKDDENVAVDDPQGVFDDLA